MGGRLNAKPNLSQISLLWALQTCSSYGIRKTARMRHRTETSALLSWQFECEQKWGYSKWLMINNGQSGMILVDDNASSG